jgi:glycosyltransferase involved in cell wall biosynthesis
MTVDVPLSVSVVIPSYHRPENLAKCLTGLFSLESIPDEVVVVRHVDDEKTAALLRTSTNPVKEVVTQKPGTPLARQLGVEVATGDIIAFIDDDAIPHREWLTRLRAAFATSSVGGVGGRDIVHQAGIPEASESNKVGHLTWWGRTIGNHHVGLGGPRSVEFLKGCNAAYRRDAVGIALGLRGNHGDDMATGLFVHSQGLQLVYDPNILVDHYPGVRPAVDRLVFLNNAYNVAYIVCSLYPSHRWRFRLYHFVIGNRASPGVIRTLVGRVRHEPMMNARDLVATQRAVWEAMRAAKAHALEFWTPPGSSSAGRLRALQAH